MTSFKRKFAAAMLSTAVLIAAPVHAQQAPASPADTDPVKMGWMQGSPPPPDKRISIHDAPSRQWPQLRWSFSNFRELVPTARVSRGNGPVAKLRGK